MSGPITHTSSVGYRDNGIAAAGCRGLTEKSVRLLNALQLGLGSRVAKLRYRVGQCSRKVWQIHTRTSGVMGVRVPTPYGFNRHSIPPGVENIQDASFRIMPQLYSDGLAGRRPAKLFRIPMGQRGEARNFFGAIIANSQLDGIGAIGAVHNTRIRNIDFSVRGCRRKGADNRQSKGDRNRAHS